MRACAPEYNSWQNESLPLSHVLSQQLSHVCVFLCVWAQMDFLEHPSITDVVVCRTVLEEVRGVLCCFFLGGGQNELAGVGMQGTVWRWRKEGQGLRGSTRRGSNQRHGSRSNRLLYV